MILPHLVPHQAHRTGVAPFVLENVDVHDSAMKEPANQLPQFSPDHVRLFSHEAILTRNGLGSQQVSHT